MTAVVKDVGGEGGGGAGLEGEGGNKSTLVLEKLRRKKQRQQQKAQLPLPVGRRFRYTQKFRSGANQTLPESFLIVSLPTFTTLHGKIKTRPRTLSAISWSGWTIRRKREGRREAEDWREGRPHVMARA